MLFSRRLRRFEVSSAQGRVNTVKHDIACRVRGPHSPWTLLHRLVIAREISESNGAQGLPLATDREASMRKRESVLVLVSTLVFGLAGCGAGLGDPEGTADSAL